MFDRRRFVTAPVISDVATPLAHALPTTGRVGETGLLRLGTGLGLVGWTGTAVVGWTVGPSAGPLALAWWVLPVTAMLFVIGRHADDTVRFSVPLLGWGLLNGTATTVTVWAVTVGASPGTIPVVWLADFTLGYAWTAVALGRATHTGRARGYTVAALVCAVTVGFGIAGVAGGVAAGYPVVAVLHVGPLALDARGVFGERGT